MEYVSKMGLGEWSLPHISLFLSAAFPLTGANQDVRPVPFPPALQAAQLCLAPTGCFQVVLPRISPSKRNRWHSSGPGPSEHHMQYGVIQCSMWVNGEDLGLDYGAVWARSSLWAVCWTPLFYENVRQTLEADSWLESPSQGRSCLEQRSGQDDVLRPLPTPLFYDCEIVLDVMQD